MSCRRAKWFLSDLGVSFEERDVIKNPLSAEEVDRLIGAGNPIAYFNPKNPKVKAKGYLQTPPPREEVVKILAADGNLLRRPIVTMGERKVLGWDEKEMKALLA
ncbi:MAG: hypothetical protein HZA54_06410 [Planctomycetes bacterium]|nr:hypothetical protein [Planctomycetota bacterium]